ncbi:MAG: 1-acyl-sn-glycerol-3-phosphate acyltransferase [Saccharofermentans sp.]|nr:1-acyl-sn-glycerol-3-phosphate acyltransferase [Saccharofermentans sp.]
MANELVPAKDNKPAVKKQDMDIGHVPSNFWYHIVGEEILVTLIAAFTHIKVKPDQDYLNEEGPVIVIANHASYLDPMVMSKLTRGRPVNFVCGEFLFRNHFWGNAFKKGGAIPKKQFVVDAVSVKSMMKVLKRKGVLLLFPEATRSVDGSTIAIDDGVAKMAKKVNAAIYIAHIHGAYAAMPRWGSGIRNGKITAEFVRKLPASKTAEMTADELQSYILDGLKYNENDYQREHKLTYKGKNLAKGLDNIAYQCPKCKEEFSMKWGGKGNGNAIVCSKCGNTAIMNVYGLLDKAKEEDVIFDDLKKWTSWEKQEVMDQLKKGDFHMQLKAELHKVFDDTTFARTGDGTVTITSTEIIYEGTDCDGKDGIPYKKGKVKSGYKNRSLEGVSKPSKHVFEIANMKGMVADYGECFEIYDSKGELFRFYVDGQKVYKAQLVVQLLGKIQ